MSASHSSGVLKPNRFLGRLLSLAAIASHPTWLTCAMPVLFGRYWRIRPFVFSLVPRSQEWCGVAKRGSSASHVRPTLALSGPGKAAFCPVRCSNLLCDEFRCP